MGLDDACYTGGDLKLVLGLGLSITSSEETTTTATTSDHRQKKKPTSCSTNFIPTISSNFEPSLTLGLSGELSNYQVPKKVDVNYKGCSDYHQEACDLSQQTSPLSTTAVSSFSSGRVKRERDLSNDDQEQEVEAVERVSSRVSDEDEDGSIAARKKLRLTKDQSALLEESFKQHITLNPKQKQALARQLNLRPRQVEVWFQNRRARTKLKQTEVDCEVLKKCCETLTNENRRLQKELQELKEMKLAPPLYMPMPAATLTMCPSCERIGAVNDSTVPKNPFSVPPKPHFYKLFTNSSAAC
ncbi:Homeobox-leucine zipper protein family [Quillaja saponaria]|uniref:Homeobox-leucine zipper protein family n=1 Tax=Quillaja saponaria TaxID=32244 RepID=A0AAD7L760_QUISA|nr:Homeobox-leucine zipper protein family [Quillaja saponaria]